jgi:DNA-binding transcriptional regulator/RsmH inhibitor MraZ
MSAQIITLAGAFKTQKDLQEYCDSQFVAMRAAIEKIKSLQDEVTHLQQLLASTTPLISDENTTRIIVTPEAALVDAQIQLLQRAAMTRQMSLEEVKTLDLLIKNKRLLSGDPTTIDGERNCLSLALFKS